MPSLEQNKRLWSQYDWTHSGEEWSARWGGTHHLWTTALLPRLGAFVQDGSRVLEIGPGYGRFTAYLAPMCAHLTVVDLASNCIEHCRRRFARVRNIDFFVNDGRSLPFIAGESIDLAVSFDSLVHADHETLNAYIHELDRVLSPQGVAVLHHSNLMSLLRVAGIEPRSLNRHMRSPDVDAACVSAMTATLDRTECCLQEHISWDESGSLIDCISVLRRVMTGDRRPGPKTILNPGFFPEACRLSQVMTLYSSFAKSPDVVQ